MQDKRLQILQVVLSQDLDLFNKKLALRSLIGALWLFFSPLNVSPDQAGLVLGVDHRTVRDLFVNFRQWLTPLMEVRAKHAPT